MWWVCIASRMRDRAGCSFFLKLTFNIMPNQSSDIATKQEAALIKGPIVGSHGLESGGKLHFIDDKITVPASVLGSGERLRFGKLPAGSKLVPGAVTLSSNHSATVAGSINLSPLDGSAATNVPGVVINLEATTTGSLNDNQDYPIVTKDSWVEFSPTANTTFSGTVVVRARIGHLLNS